MVTFASSTLWIAAFSYMMVWMVCTSESRPHSLGHATEMFSVSLEKHVESSTHLNFQMRNLQSASISVRPVYTQRRKLGANRHGF